ncbi:DUF1345 domain-containing protein [Azospirillum griseum]|uniref:DUF1345 domain-containing protein n=1 Tax=Azospirillum griseum TaxID=2496639 RepID=UPI001FE42428|nr:DUF1345 domain-containing protein [Azospirillum griseum]
MTSGVGRARRSVRHVVSHLGNRPSLLIAAALALVLAVLGSLWVRPVTAALVGWDSGVALYLLLSTPVMLRASVESIRLRAQRLDPGKVGVLAGAMLVATATLIAIWVELVTAKGSPHAGAVAGVATVTVLLSWGFLHVFFAQHYAHDYWLDSPHRAGAKPLEFPGNDQPDYLEFLYFSFTVGMTAQVSDVITRSAPLRRVVLMHGILSFLFNTTVLALVVNLAVGLVN